MSSVLNAYLTKRGVIYSNGIEVVRTSGLEEARRLTKLLSDLKACTKQKGKFVHIYH